jgi:hypothetical protein
MAQDERPKLVRVTEDCFAMVIRAYMASPKFTGYSPATQDLWGRELRLAMHPDALGAVSMQSIRPALVQAFLDGLDGRPGKQAAAKAALTQLEGWAIVRDILPRPIMTGVETGRPSGGHIPWTDAQVEIAEHHARADLARAVTLGANTGQRGSDLVRMNPTDVEMFKHQGDAEENWPGGVGADRITVGGGHGNMGATAGTVPHEDRWRCVEPQGTDTGMEV